MSPQQEKSSSSSIWFGGDILCDSLGIELGPVRVEVFLFVMPLVKESKKESKATWPVGKAADSAPERASSS